MLLLSKIFLLKTKFIFSIKKLKYLKYIRIIKLITIIVKKSNVLTLFCFALIKNLPKKKLNKIEFISIRVYEVKKTFYVDYASNFML